MVRALHSYVESTRTPGKMARRNNLADMIEDYMKHDKHEKWGFVIYRCTYASEEDWDVFLESFRKHVRKILEFYIGLDIFECLDMTVIDAPESASTQEVREMFREWCKDEEDIEDWGGVCQRLRFCLQVDEAILCSIVQASTIPKNMEPPDQPHGGFVNIIWKTWDPVEADDGLTYELVEGVTLKDVGWMRIALRAVVIVYDFLRQEDMWQSQYVRPPKVLLH